ncbi:MAG: class I SAM-dependent methyltransferase [Solirubrobacterales bacterium]|nr:class I SAM-dependent methyltransferase [Solirubrobacterales bacterium]MBV9473827.1 class I SAM-dependent methyltransferase [Solirubrobacterales bacterium]
MSQLDAAPTDEPAFNVFGEEYSRKRYEPRPGDQYYLHLVDLQRALRPRLERARGTWLDYGAASSPYLRFMSEAEVRRADFATDAEFARGLDYALEPDRPCPAPDEAFDGILSTQVLEHVEDPHAYLTDALRMLRPGGQLVLTTHGIWEDHPCPLDLHRWTQQGLRHALAKAGFEVAECVPLTCGVRGLLEQLTLRLDETWWRDRRWRRERVVGPLGRYAGVTGLILGALRLYSRHRPQGLHAYAERFFAAEGIGREGVDKIYTALLITGSKPA